MAAILTDDLLAAQLPQSCEMVRARRDQVRGIGAESAVPHPALVAVQRGLERECVGVAICGEVLLRAGIMRLRGVDGPDTGRVVCGTGS